MAFVAAFLAGAVAGVAVAGVAAREASRRKEERLGRLLAFAMHELNTPITAINMTAMNLLSEAFGDLPAPLRPWIEMTREQIGRLACLVGEVRDFAHAELSQDLRIGVAELAASEILGVALVCVRQTMEQAGADFQVATAPDLPSVRTDLDRAARCLSSMLFHARKFRASGPITLAVSSADERVAFVVAYEGARLSPAQVAESLDLYYTARRRGDQVLCATGMGLGLLRGVARRIGGDFNFESTPSGSAKATLSFPAVEAAS